MRTFSTIILHCTATPEGRDYSVEQVRKWHLKRGFTDIGYHYLVHPDGRVDAGRPLELPGAHCQGHNADSIGIAYVGGLTADGKHPKNTLTPAQEQSLVRLIKDLAETYPTLRDSSKDSSKLPVPSSNRLPPHSTISNQQSTIEQVPSSKADASFKSPVSSFKSAEGSLRLHGHNEYSLKRCPCFDVQEWRQKVGL